MCCFRLFAWLLSGVQLLGHKNLLSRRFEDGNITFPDEVTCASDYLTHQNDEFPDRTIIEPPSQLPSSILFVTNIKLLNTLITTGVLSDAVLTSAYPSLSVETIRQTAIFPIHVTMTGKGSPSKSSTIYCSSSSQESFGIIVVGGMSQKRGCGFGLGLLRLGFFDAATVAGTSGRQFTWNAWVLNNESESRRCGILKVSSFY